MAVNYTRRVPISYAHESAAHAKDVRVLWRLLRKNGVDARLDAPFTEQRHDWTVWMMAEIEAADFVVVVASPAYKARSEGSRPQGGGRGVEFEGALLREALYRDRSTWESRILPVLLPGMKIADIPVWLGPYTSTSFTVATLTRDGIDPLLRAILARPRHPSPPLGTPPRLGPDPAPRGPGPGVPDIDRSQQLQGAHAAWARHRNPARRGSEQGGRLPGN